MILKFLAAAVELRTGTAEMGTSPERIRSSATFFGFGFEFLEKNRIRYEWYGVYRMYVKAWQ